MLKTPPWEEVNGADKHRPRHQKERFSQLLDDLIIMDLTP